MIPSSVIGHLRRRRASASPSTVQRADAVVPLPRSSMWLLEFSVACVALGAAVLLGLAR